MSGRYAVNAAPNEGWDERIIAVHCGRLVTNFIVVSDRYVVLVDTMINADTCRIMLSIAASYMDGSRQLLAINTHADFDHCWGNQLFVGPEAVYPAPIIATRRCFERFFSGDPDVFWPQLKAQDPDLYGAVVPTPPTLLFENQFYIEGGDLTLRLFQTPGHQRDHISIMIPEISTLLAGDAAEWPFPEAERSATLPQMRASLAQLAALNAETALYCHAPLDMGPHLIHRNITYFNLLEQRCREAMDLGVPASLGEQENPAELINLPLSEALPGESSYPDSFDRKHNRQIRMMLEYLGQSALASGT